MSDILLFAREKECWKDGIVPDEFMNSQEIEEQQLKIQTMEALDDL